MEHTGSLLAAVLAVTEVEAEVVAKKLEIDSPKQQKLQGGCPHILGCMNACILISYFANVLVTSFILPVLFSRKTDNCLIVISHTFLF